MTFCSSHGVIGMASTRPLVTGYLPKLPNLILVLFLTLVLQRIVQTHPMATDHESTPISRNDIQDVSPTPTFKMWADHSDPIPTATPHPTSDISVPVYELGAQPRLFVSPEKDDPSGRKVERNPATVAFTTVWMPGSRIGSSTRAGNSLPDMQQNRSVEYDSQRNSVVELVTNWTLASPTPLVISDTVVYGSSKELPELDSHSSQVSLVSVVPTAFPEAPVEVIHAMAPLRPLASDRLTVESSMRTLELRSAFAVSPTGPSENVMSESNRVQTLPMSTNEVNVSPSLESPRIQDTVGMATANADSSERTTNSTEPTSGNVSTLHKDNQLHSPTYADIPSVNDSADSSDQVGTTANATIAPTSSSNYTAFGEQTNAKVLLMSTAADVAIGQPSSESQVQTEANLPAGTVAGIVVASIGFIGILAAGLGLFVIKRLRGLNNKTYNSKFSGDSCSYLDSLQVSYINSHTELPKESSEEMFSLDNDSFLNSLEAMTMENYWAEDRKSTKV